MRRRNARTFHAGAMFRMTNNTAAKPAVMVGVKTSRLPVSVIIPNARSWRKRVVPVFKLHHF